MTNTNVLVLGGTGRTGGRIVRRLRGCGVQTRVASRRSKQPFPWGDRPTGDAALRGASAARSALRTAASGAWNARIESRA